MNDDRELEVDLAYAVRSLRAVEGVYALDVPLAARRHPDSLSFAVVLLPYDLERLVAAHYALLASTTYEATGRVLYVNGAMPAPVPMHHARRIVLASDERAAAARRAAERAIDAEYIRRMEAEAVRRVALERDLGRALHANPAASTVVASLESGEFEITASDGARWIVSRDPFPSPTRRLLVLDEDPETVDPLRELGRSIEVVHESDGWRALERLQREAFDLILCATSVEGFTAASFYRAVAANVPTMASRVVFIGPRGTAAVDVPASARGRVVTRPLEIEVIRGLLKNKSESS